MRRFIAAVISVAIVSVAWSVVARAQGETHKIYLPSVRRDATWTPTATLTPTITPSPGPSPTRGGIECGTVFYSGFEEDGVWQVSNNNDAYIERTRPFAGHRSMHITPKANREVTVSSPRFKWSGGDVIIAAKLTAAWRGETDDPEPASDELILSAAVDVDDLLSPVLARLSNRSATGAWKIATQEFNEGDVELFPEIRDALFRAIGSESDSNRTTWWIDEVRVETCVKPGT